ncbi:MAG: DUF2065 domain-containing protein [Proteobacteria bacterium]|nr:DUF2065 domain-containing protein [Pseudomonadota bacterium]MDA1350817.1 DUF2065 domain-containing protein [Pseudomonadota bacterium]
MLEDIIRAVGLMLVFEGIIPFLAPKRWCNMAKILGKIDENTMRLTGLFSMLLGLLLLFFWR